MGFQYEVEVIILLDFWNSGQHAIQRQQFSGSFTPMLIISKFVSKQNSFPFPHV